MNKSRQLTLPLPVSKPFVIDEWFQVDVYNNSREHGFHEGEFNWGEKIALIHSEISEALEAARVGDSPSEKIPDFSHIEEELADAMIRILDVAEYKGLNVIGACAAKHRYNRSRPYKHGGKRF